ncbi:MerR family transcriptional regulator [Streptomyces chitinivorans]|uniref:MerR family transcriptional regulator n=1 Tax=Streptomyces chitinivorans TaxID=1257027 RepID=A0ABW7HSG5_9ACTN|nr:MerR family transcriptional regulator [Streptomyces chitinivorans]MDH2407806.1 MerR family transcriptional regulator [Streptomyces chitinivorans]
MQLSDLSRRTGVPVRTLRLYARVNLLPEADVYDMSHVRRVVLVRVLLDVGGLRHSEIHDILRRVDSSPGSLHDLLGAVQYALPARGSECRDREWEQARERAGALAERRGWRVGPDNPAWLTLVQALVACEWLGQRDLLEMIDTYAEALERVAEAEVRLIRARPDPESAAASMVSTTVLGDVMLSALRRLMHEHFSSAVDHGPAADR